MRADLSETKYDKKLLKEIVPKMSQGYTVAMLACDWGICKQTFYQWLAAHNDFRKEYRKGVTAAESFLKRKELANLENPNYNTKLHELHVRNRVKNSSERYSPDMTPQQKLVAVQQDIAEGQYFADDGLKLAGIIEISARIQKDQDAFTMLEKVRQHNEELTLKNIHLENRLKALEQENE